MVHTKHQTTNWKTYILYATGGVHSILQGTAAVLLRTLLRLYLLNGMEFHLSFKPQAYTMCIYLHSISVTLILSSVDLRVMRFYEIIESKF